MTDFKELFNKYLSDERLDCKNYLSHHLMANRVERPSEYLMDEFVQRALKLEENTNEVLSTLKKAYLKHHLNNQEIGWNELDDMMCDTLCNSMGDKEFSKWLEKEAIK